MPRVNHPPPADHSPRADQLTRDNHSPPADHPASVNHPPRGKNPVWTVYDKLRTALLNVKYYSRRLATFERWNFWLQLILAASAPTSAIAGLWFWGDEWGRIAWKYFGIVAAIAAVLKPLLSMTTRIKDFESVVVGYRALE